MKKIVISIVTLIVLILICFFTMYNNGLSAPNKNGEDVTISISGSSSKIISDLKAEGLIKDEFFAKIYLKLNTPQFKANTYILNSSMSFSEIFDILNEGKTDSSLFDRLQVIEGQTIPQVSKTVSSVFNVEDTEVLKTWSDVIFLETLIDEYWFLEDIILSSDIMYSLEGYLAPETYLFMTEQESIQSLTRMMLDQTEANLAPYKQDIIRFTVDGKNWSVHEFLSFSSVVQNESLFLSDHAKIAGVFIHRLENNTSSGTAKKLQSDVTVNYANQEKKVAVTYGDLSVNSKYNTYLYPGLPIGPISAISTIIIESCLNYDIMDELFFFAINDGSVIYTKTYAEHLKEISIAKAAGLWLED